MLFHEDGPAGGPENMARDLALLGKLELTELACRVYAWDGAWVSLGRFQNPSTDVVKGFEQWVVRPTGGKAVLHGHDQTVGLAMRFDREHGVRGAYESATAPLIEALRDCGLEAALGAAGRTPIESLSRSAATEAACAQAVLKPRTPEHALKRRPPTTQVGVADCFASTSPFDIVEAKSGAKVCGCALKVLRDRVLLQASIPYCEALIPPESAIVGAVPSPIFEWDHSRFASAMREACATMFSRR